MDSVTLNARSPFSMFPIGDEHNWATKFKFPVVYIESVISKYRASKIRVSHMSNGHLYVILARCRGSSDSHSPPVFRLYNACRL